MDPKYKPRSIWYYAQVLFMLILLLETPTYFGVEWGAVRHETSGVNILYFLLRYSLYMSYVNIFRGFSTIYFYFFCLDTVQNLAHFVFTAAGYLRLQIALKEYRYMLWLILLATIAKFCTKS